MKVLFVHGNSSSATTFNNISVEFPSRSLSLQGHDNRSNADGYSLSFLVDDIVSQVSSEKDVVLIGHSLGGHVCIQAMPFLNNVRGLVLSGTPPLRKPLNLNEAFYSNEYMGQFFKPEFDEPYLQKVFENMTVVPGHLDSLTKDFKKTDPLMRVGLANDIAAGTVPDEVEILTTLSIPILIIHGESDSFVNLEYIKSLQGEVKVTIEVVKDCGHYPQLERPEEFSSIVDRFIRSQLE